MTITLAVEKDIPELCQLLGYLFDQETEFEQDIEAQQCGLKIIIVTPEIGNILVVRKEGLIIGMVSLLYSVSTALGGRVCMLEDMVVAPEFRGSNSGSELLEHAIEYARKQGALRITLLTDQDNEAAQRFYHRQGFRLSSMMPMRRLILKVS